MKTNLDKCKEIARLYLYQEIEPTMIPTIVTHPFFENSIFPSFKNKNTFVDITEDKEERDYIVSKYEIKIENAKEIKEIFHFMRSPYRIQYFSHVKNYLSEKDYGEMLAFSWVSDEYANKNSVVGIDEILSYFKKSQKVYLMNEDELEKYKKLPEVVKIYRGVTGYNIDNEKALSWTLSKEKADWFAHRFNQNGKILEKEIKREKILAYFNSRDEDEVIVDFEK